MFNAVYRPIHKTPKGNLVLGTPFKEPIEATYLKDAFIQGKAGERSLIDLGSGGGVITGRVFVGVAYK